MIFLLSSFCNKRKILVKIKHYKHIEKYSNDRFAEGIISPNPISLGLSQQLAPPELFFGLENQDATNLNLLDVCIMKVD